MVVHSKRLLPSTIHSVFVTPPTVALSLAGIGMWIATLAGMAALGVAVWKLVQRQESRDPSFQKKLDDDDARAEGRR